MSRGWYKEILQGLLPMEQPFCSDKWVRNQFWFCSGLHSRNEFI